MPTNSEDRQDYAPSINSELANTGILDVPGNAYSITHMVECLRNRDRHRRPIAFIGAGASAGLYPLWLQLLTDLGNNAVEQGKATEGMRQAWMAKAKDDPPAAATRILAVLGLPDFRNFMISRFRR